VRRVEAAFDALQPVALLDVARGEALGRRNLGPFEIGEFRFELGRAHIGPHGFAALDARIGAGFELRLDARERVVVHLRNARHVGAVSFDVEFQPIIDAAQSALFVAAEEERGRAVRAALVEEPEPAVRVAEEDEILTQQADADGR
jgi:hypothetical protein